MFKRFLTCFVALLLALPFAALGEVTVNKEGYPIVSEPIVMTVVNSQSPIQIDFNDIVVLKDFEEVSGIDMQYRNIPSSDAATQLSLLLASGELPDILFKMDVSATDQAKYAEEGMFLPLSDYAEYTPNLVKWLDKYPSARDAITQVDGKYYGAPYILAGEAIRMSTKMFFNTDVLEKLGYDAIPTTTDGLLEYLRKAKELDYNGNGEADEIPLAATSIANVIRPLAGSFGLYNRGGSHANLLALEDGTMDYAYRTENYREMLRFLNTLYTEKLLDQDIFTMDFAQLIAKASTGRALTYCFVNNSPVAGSKYEDFTIGITEPFEGPQGYKFWGPYTLPSSTAGQFVITDTCKYPAAAARWMDHWYSDEGIIAYFMGVEGVTYEKDADSPGGLKLTDYVVKNPDGINFEQVLAKYVSWAGGSNPSVATNEYFKGGETWPASVRCADGLINFIPEEVWAPVARFYTAEEAREMSQLSSEIETYHSEWRAYFISGQKSLDDDWDTYVKGFDGMRLDRWLEIYNKALKEAGYIK